MIKYAIMIKPDIEKGLPAFIFAIYNSFDEAELNRLSLKYPDRFYVTEYYGEEVI